MVELEIPTHGREEMVDLNERVGQAVAESGVDEGICLVYVPHTTCGIAVNEGYDPDVQRDFLAHAAETIPQRGRWRHAEGNSDAHVKAIYVGTSVALPVTGGRLRLGRWQTVVLCEFDGPRRRSVWVTVS